MEYSKDEIERVLISNEEIQKRLDELAARVNADYAGHDLLASSRARSRSLRTCSGA